MSFFHFLKRRVASWVVSPPDSRKRKFLRSGRFANALLAGAFFQVHFSWEGRVKHKGEKESSSLFLRRLGHRWKNLTDLPIGGGKGSDLFYTCRDLTARRGGLPKALQNTMLKYLFL